MPAPDSFELIVLDKRSLADGVIQLTLARPDGRTLPPWEPGAHLDLHLGTPPVIRQYSLCSSPADRDRYQVAVLREPRSRGGSSHVHDRLSPGDRVLASAPRNHFQLVASPRYLFVAGGIGITPILPMIEAAENAGADWHLLYGGRTGTSMAFLPELASRAARVSLRPADVHGPLDLAGFLDRPREDTVVYICGPEQLLRAVEEQCRHWPAGVLHLERFAPPERVTDQPDRAFDVEFVQSGMTVTVPAGKSIVAAAEEAGVPVVYSCEEGTCGSCETTVLDGEPDHRDSLLDDDERAARSCMLICVSRALTPRLVLDA
ncbi:MULTISPECIES: PDR/VanB family oxidoreductase [unclassified Blastococcus]